MAKLDKLITYAYLKDEVDLPTNIDDQEFDKPITRAQEVLRMLMGDGFYQDFQMKYQAGTLTTVYNSLFPYIKQFLAWQANEIWTIKANYKPTRSGFRVHSEDNSQIASDAAMAAIIRDAKSQSQYYKNILVDFMNNHSTDYPLHSAHCGGNNTGNSFRVTAVRNKEVQPDTYGTQIIRSRW